MLRPSVTDMNVWAGLLSRGFFHDLSLYRSYTKRIQSSIGPLFVDRLNSM